MLFIVLSLVTSSSVFASNSSIEEKGNLISIEENLISINENGNKVIEISDDLYAVVSEKIVYNELTEEMKTNQKSSGYQEEVVLSRVYFELTQSLDEAERVADTLPAELSTANGITAKGDFWSGSWIEDTWDLWWGTGYKVRLSPSDASYVGSMSNTAISGLIAAIGIAAKANPYTALLYGALTAMGLTTLGKAATNDDGSFEMTFYLPNLAAITECLVIGQFLGQAKIKGVFYELFWSGQKRCA